MESVDTTLSFLLQMSSTEATLAVVTGASSGIGRATAIALAKRGRPVLLLARRAERLAEVQSEIGAEGCMTASVDVTDADAVTAAVDAAVAKHGPVDVLVNNAGVSTCFSRGGESVGRVRGECGGLGGWMG